MKKAQRFACLGLLLFTITASAHAQPPSLPKPPPLVTSPGIADIPTDAWVYGDLLRLQDRKRFGQYPVGAFKLRAHTRQGFALLIARELETLGSTFDKEVRQDPELLNALHRLVEEFAPELRQQGVSLFAVQARIAALAQARATGRETGPFPDVPENHWAFQAVEKLRQTGIVIGYPGGTFIQP